MEITKRSETAGARFNHADGSSNVFRMARSPSKAGKGFRSDNRQRRCLGIRCAYPTPHPFDSRELKSNASL
jgi:hypothetical protein